MCKEGYFFVFYLVPLTLVCCRLVCECSKSTRGRVALHNHPHSTLCQASGRQGSTGKCPFFSHPQFSFQQLPALYIGQGRGRVGGRGGISTELDIDQREINRF